MNSNLHMDGPLWPGDEVVVTRGGVVLLQYKAKGRCVYEIDLTITESEPEKPNDQMVYTGRDGV